MISQNPGCMIVIEGYEGAGKTTQVERLASNLRSRGFTVTQLREPGGTEANEMIRKVITEYGATMPIQSLVCLFLACKRNLLVDCILPAKRRGEIVLLDRYTPSLMAYQTSMGSVSMSQIQHLLEETQTDIDPDIFIWLDAPKEVLIERVHSRNGAAVGTDNFEDEALAQADKIISAYREYFEYKNSRHDACYRIAADQTEEKVQEDIFLTIAHHYPAITRS